MDVVGNVALLIVAVEVALESIMSSTGSIVVVLPGGEEGSNMLLSPESTAIEVSVVAVAVAVAVAAVVVSRRDNSSNIVVVGHCVAPIVSNSSVRPVVSPPTIVFAVDDVVAVGTIPTPVAVADTVSSSCTFLCCCCRCCHRCC